jgi:CubicO group peptidase (beta-lactamase class C family)
MAAAEDVMAVSARTRPLLERADPASHGVDPERIDRLYQLIEQHIAEGRYPGAQVAMARRGKLLAFGTFGQDRMAPTPRAASDETLWLLFSQTKVITTAAVWVLVDCGALSFADRIAEHVPEFGVGGKADITLQQVLTHQAGYPSARPGPEVWSDHEALRKAVCNFNLEWWPGSRVHYHGASAHRRIGALDGGRPD